MEETILENGTDQISTTAPAENEKQIIVSERAQRDMSSMGKWMVFLGILNLISGIFLIILGIFTTSINVIEISSLGVFVNIIYLITGALTLYLGRKLYFAGKGFISAAVYSDSLQLEKAVSEQKSFFSCWGIIIIIYLIVLFVLIIAASS